MRSFLDSMELQLLVSHFSGLISSESYPLILSCCCFSKLNLLLLDLLESRLLLAINGDSVSVGSYLFDFYSLPSLNVTFLENLFLFLSTKVLDFRSLLLITF